VFVDSVRSQVGEKWVGGWVVKFGGKVLRIPLK